MSAHSGTAQNGSVELFWTLDQPSEGAEKGGQEDRILLINGLGSPLVAFEPSLVSLFVERGFAVTRFDNRDVGRSTRVPRGRPDRPPSAHPYTLADMAGDSVAVLDALGWSSAHVLGQSMGGMIAQQVAIDHRYRVQGLILLMTASGARGFGRSTPEALRALMQPSPADSDGWLAHRLRTERIWASPDHWSEQWVRAKGLAMLDHGIDPEGASRQYRAVMASGSRDEALAGLNTPTLVLHGAKDTLIHPDGGRHLAEVIPGATYIEIDDLGHDLPPAVMPRLVDLTVEFIRADTVR